MLTNSGSLKEKAMVLPSGRPRLMLSNQINITESSGLKFLPSSSICMGMRSRPLGSQAMLTPPLSSLRLGIWPMLMKLDQLVRTVCRATPSPAPSVIKTGSTVDNIPEQRLCQLNFLQIKIFLASKRWEIYYCYIIDILQKNMIQSYIPLKSISGSLGDTSCLSIDLSISKLSFSSRISIFPKLERGNSS